MADGAVKATGAPRLRGFVIYNALDRRGVLDQREGYRMEMRK